MSHSITPQTVASDALLICTAQGIAVAPVASTKRCARCGEIKDTRQYNLEKRKRDGFSAWCKSCKSKDQSRRRTEILQHDPSWTERRKTSAKLARLVAGGEITKPSACPRCARTVTAREMQARFKDGRDPRTVEWRCRTCALADLGKSFVAVCRWCDEPFSAQTHQLRRGAARYCSVRCRNAWMKQTAEHVRQTGARARKKAEQVYVDDRF